MIDTVSRDGEHKVVALWKYDKGEANGAPFVYFGIDAMGGSGQTAKLLIDYARRLLDTLDWRWGPCHIEVMMVPEPRWQGEGSDGGRRNPAQEASGEAADSEPVLIEINAGRWNGEEFQMLAEMCNGCDALQATLDAYLDAEAWEQLPVAPPSELLVHGKNVKLVSHVEGELTASPSTTHAEVLGALPSLLRFAPEADAVGERVIRTIDLNSCAGYCYLVHADPAVVEADYQTLRELQPRLFEVGASAHAPG